MRKAAPRSAPGSRAREPATAPVVRPPNPAGGRLSVIDAAGLRDEVLERRATDSAVDVIRWLKSEHGINITASGFSRWHKTAVGVAQLESDVAQAEQAEARTRRVVAETLSGDVERDLLYMRNAIDVLHGVATGQVLDLDPNTGKLTPSEGAESPKAEVRVRAAKELVGAIGVRVDLTGEKLRKAKDKMAGTLGALVGEVAGRHYGWSAGSAKGDDDATRPAEGATAGGGE